MWFVFLELSGQRTGTGWGPNPIQFTEVEAWQRLTGRTLKPWEVRAILAMDRAFLVISAELAKPEDEQVSDEGLTPAIFDRMFG